MIISLPVVHKVIEALYSKLDEETVKDRTLAFVGANFGKRAAQILDA